jgi:3-methyladenine DNA glycosylase Mpg
MKGRRMIDASSLAVHDLCRGPGNVTMAMAIGLADNRTDLLGDEIFIDDRRLTIGPIAWGPRIGIRVGTDRLWRAYIAGHPAVSATNGPGAASASALRQPGVER